MKISKLALLSVVLSVAVTGTAAQAAPLLFSFTGGTFAGPVTASFQLDSNPTPSSINDQSAFGIGQIFFNNVPGVFNGTAQTASSISFGTGLASQFQILGTSAGFAQFGGQTVFTGSLANPVFSPGSFQFTGFSSGTLTVSQVTAAVPEPVTWAMMLIGFGGMGFAMRGRAKVSTAVSYV